MPANVSADPQFFAAMFASIVADLAMITDTAIHAGEPRCERAITRVAGAGEVHISFRFAVQQGGVKREGCVLVPLPDAIALAGSLMMLPREEIEARRREKLLDRPLKEAMLEVGNFIAGAIDAVIRTWYSSDAVCRPLGCQGVRAGVRPAFAYVEGVELAVATAAVTIQGFEPFDVIAQLPPPRD